MRTTRATRDFARTPEAGAPRWLVSTWLGITVVCLSACARSSREASAHVFQFDEYGRLVELVGMDGRKTAYRYDRDGRIISTLYAGGYARYSYDPAGNLVETRDHTGSTELHRDPFGRVTDVISQHSPKRLIHYEYDPSGNRTETAVYNLESAATNDRLRREVKLLQGKVSTTAKSWIQRREAVRLLVEKLRRDDSNSAISTEYRIKYRYDLVGNLKRIENTDGAIEYEYSPEKDEVRRRLPNGVTTVWKADAESRRYMVRHQTPALGLIAEYEYAFDSSGKLHQIRERSEARERTVQIHWDPSGSLKGFISSDGPVIEVKYDSAGRRSSVNAAQRSTEYSYDDQGRLTRAGGTEYRWDNNGSLAARTVDGRTSVFLYDGQGFITHVKTGDQALTYRRDSEGSVVSIASREGTRHFLKDFASGAPLLEFDDKNRIARSFIVASDLVAESDSASKTRYTLSDGLGRIRYRVDQAGGLEQAQSPEPRDTLAALSAIAIVPGNIDDAFELERSGLGRRGTVPIPDQSGRAADLVLAAGVTGDSYREQVSNRFGAFLSGTSKNSFEIVLKGINNGWQDTIRDTNRVYPNGEGIFLPTFTLHKSLHPVATGFEKLANTLGPLGRLLQTRKIDVSELVREAWRHGKEPNSLVFESGAGFELQRNISSLVELARSRRDRHLPMIIVQSTAISPEQWKRLERVGYVVRDISEKGFVPAAIMPAEHYAGPLRHIPIVGGTVGLAVQLAAVTAQIPGWASRAEGVTPGQVGRALVGPHGFYDHQAAIRQAQQFHPFSLRNVTPDELANLWPARRPAPDGSSGLLRRDSYRDTFDMIERELGGVRLAGRSKFTGNLGRISGVTYDPASLRVILLGHRDRSVPGITAEDFAVALLLAYGNPRRHAEFSLDPADPKNPRGPWLKAVYRPAEILMGTRFGHTLYLTDWLMKQYSFGTTIDGSGRLHPRTTRVPGLKDMFQLSFESRDDVLREQEWSRLWLFAEDVHLSEREGTVRFEKVNIGVDARLQVVDRKSDTGLRDVATDETADAKRFARLFASRYDQVAQESPEFARLTEMAKAVALAIWLRDRGVPVDLEWARRNALKSMRAVERVKALEVRRENPVKRTIRKGNTTYVRTNSTRLFGGVDFEIHPRFTPGQAQTGNLGLHARVEAGKQSSSPFFTFQHDRNPAEGAVMPFTPGGREVWRKMEVAEPQRPNKMSARWGPLSAEFELNSQDLPTDAQLANGVRATFGYNTDSRLREVRIGEVSGRQIIGIRGDSGSEWKVGSRAGDAVTYRWDQSGELASVNVNGKEWARYSFDAAKNERHAVYPGYRELIRYDDQGRVRQYERRHDAGDTTPSEVERLTIDYDASGNISQLIHNDGAPWQVPRGSQGSRYAREPVVPPSAFGATPNSLHTPDGVRYQVTRRRRSRLAGLFSRSGGQTVELARTVGERNPFPAREAPIARLAELLSNRQTAVLYTGSFDAGVNGVLLMQLGGRVISTTRSAMDDFLNGKGTIPEIEETFASADRPSRIIIWAEGADSATRFAGTETGVPALDPLRLTAALKHKYGKQTEFLLGHDIELALENAANLPAIRGPESVAAYVTGKEFNVQDGRVIQTLSRELTELGIRVADGVTALEQPGVIVVSGHKESALRDYLRELGRHGGLAEKYVVLGSCYEQGDVRFNTELIESFNARGVLFFGERINPSALRDVILNLGRVLRNNSGAPDRLEHFWDRAVEEAIRGTDMDGLKKQIEILRRAISQVSQHLTLGDTIVQHPV